MENCIFCKISNSELPCTKIYENDDFIAFLDIKPLNPGHTLIIPKKHYRWVWDVEDICGYFTVVQKIAKAIKKAFDTELVASLVFGEEVPHAHVSLVPRLPDDGHDHAINLDLHKQISDEEMQEIAEKIKQNL